MKITASFKEYVINKHSKDIATEEIEDDYVVKSIGGFGVWHLLVCATASTTRLIAMWNILSILFLTPNTDFLCVQFNGNITSDAENSTCYENCTKYTYFESVFELSIISDFDLVCDRAWLASLTQVAMVFGCLVGVVVVGWFSDRYGRKKAIILSTFSVVPFMFIITLSINYPMFTCLRFLIGFSSGGILATTIVYVLEIVGPQYKEVVSNGALFPDFTSQLLAPIFAYFSSTWSQYLLGYGIASSLILPLLIRLPETPRWLMANGKIDEVIDVMTKAATFNKKSTVGIRENVLKTVEELRVNPQDTPKLTYLDLFRNKNLAMTTLGTVVIWFVTGVCFYGITQYVTLLGSNLYVVTFVMAISQTPAIFIGFYITKMIGRNIPAMSTNILIGLTMLILIFIPDNSIYSTVLGIFGTVVANICFAVIYLYTPELYPTSIRNMGLSFNSSASKFGAMIAPFIANTKPVWIASLMFAVLSIVAAGCCLLVPETKGKKMQDTFEE